MLVARRDEAEGWGKRLYANLAPYCPDQARTCDADRLIARGEVAQFSGLVGLRLIEIAGHAVEHQGRAQRATILALFQRQARTQEQADRLQHAHDQGAKYHQHGHQRAGTKHWAGNGGGGTEKRLCSGQCCLYWINDMKNRHVGFPFNSWLYFPG